MKKILKQKTILIALVLGFLVQINAAFAQITFPIVDTDQKLYYDSMSIITAPTATQAFYGQDAHYAGNQTDYTDNGDGTITDNVTGLMWQKSPDLDWDGDIDAADKLSYDEAMAAADTFSLAGYSDWRLPSIKEMYSLIIFSGKDPSGYSGTSTDNLVPFINTDYFDFAYGDLSANERIIDAQMASSTIYVGTTMMGDETMFGVNFADGRIKGYPTGPMPGQTVNKQFYIMYVRGNKEYGKNNFNDNLDKTITDQATALMWTQEDDGKGMTWEDAVSYAEASSIAGYNDWRLPNVKELQSIVDYTRAPSITNSAAIDPLFNCTKIKDEGGDDNYASYWSGTTHASFQASSPGGFAAYVSFGEGLGFMENPPMSGKYTLMDVHGAGCQRSDPKVGDPADYPNGNGPQGDVVRIYNYVRLVRGAGVSSINNIENNNEFNLYPNPATESISISFQNNFEEMLSVQIYNTLGEIVYTADKESASDETIDIQNLKAGVYIVKVENERGVYSERFIKK